MSEIILKNDVLEVGILPQIGASLSFLRYKGVDLLRPTDQGIPHLDSNNASMFLMIPFAGRIRGGSFVYWGITRRMAKNQIGIHDPIHGDAWKSEWQVKTHTPTHAVLTMVHDKQNGFPFPYTATVSYKLNKNKLDIQLKVDNPGLLPMPCGLGIHPFFLKEADTELKFNTKTVWAHESDPIFDKPYETPEKWSFKEKKAIKKMEFDTCFGGFDGEAEISWPGKKMSVRILTDEQFGHIVLYAPKGKDFVCLEPCTNASNAFNLAARGVIGTGIKSVGPSQSVSGDISFEFRG